MAITGSMSDFLEKKVLDLVCGAQAYTAPTGLFIGLWLSAIDDTYSGLTPGEVTGLHYARFSAVNDLNNWSTAVTGTDASGVKYNLNSFTFPTAGGTWGNISGFAICDAKDSGNILFWGHLNTPGPCNSGSAFQFAASSIIIKAN